MATALTMGAAMLASPAAAADSDQTQILPGATVTALAVDLDADGANEVVRLLDGPEPGMDLEVLDVRNGAWTPIGQMEVASQPGPDGSLDPSSEIAALLRWRLDGDDRVVLATASMLQVPDVPSTVCCVELAEVVLASQGVVLDPIETHDLRAEFVAAVDMDGDGTDELVTSATAYHDMNDTGVFRVEVHRWDGERFDRIFASEHDGQGFGVIPGDGDGRRGSELYLSPSPTGRIERIVLVDGDIRGEVGSVDLGGVAEGWVAGAANGRIVIQQPEGVRLVEWAAGGDPAVTSTLDSLAFPFLNAVGEGADGMFVQYEGFDFLRSDDPQLTIFDRDLNEIRSVPMPERVRPLWTAARNLSESGYGTGRNNFPYVGPLPTSGTRASWGFVSNGLLIEPGGTAGFTLTEVSPLVGVVPIGRAGPDDAWLVLGQGQSFGAYGLADTAAYLFPYSLGPFVTGRLVLAPADEALAVSDEPAATIRTEDGVAIETDGGTRFAASYDEFHAVVEAPFGSFVTVDDGTVPVEFEVPDGPLTVDMLPPRNGDRNRDFTRTFLVSTPDGRAQVVTWEGTFIGEPPEVTAFAETDAFALHSRIYGRASDGVSITVDGVTVEPNANGAYDVDVDAPIWPRDVIVAARDVLGNEAVERLQIVGFLDYRGLPWAAIIGLATVAAGAFLFVRTPRRRAAAAAAWDDAMLEEVDGDAI